MAIELVVQNFPYVVNGVPVYGTLEATRCSDKRMNRLAAVESAFEQGVPLQGLGASFVIRYALDQKHAKDCTDLDCTDLNNSQNYQVVNTVELSLKDKQGWKSYATELPNDERSVALAREGYDANRNGKEHLMPRSDVFIDELVKTAMREGRVAPAQKMRTLEFSVKERKSGSAYSKSPKVLAFIGDSEIAEVNAAYLRSKNRDAGSVWDLTEEELEARCPEGMVLCRPLGLGGDDFDDVDSVVADDYFDVDGWARWVVHGAQKISSGNEGCQKVRSR